MLDKIASSLPFAKNFFVSYVMLSGSLVIAAKFTSKHDLLRLCIRLRIGLAIMPLQLLELAVIIPRVFYKVFLTRTPRGSSMAGVIGCSLATETNKLCRTDHAELNAPPMLNLGTVYPQGE